MRASLTTGSPATTRSFSWKSYKAWYTDPALWPRDRSQRTLQEWCSFELHTVVVDTGGSPLEDDEFED